MSDKSATAKVIIISIVRLALGIVFICAMLFWPAGTLNYWQAWAWIAALFIPMVYSFTYLIKHDPALLERRTRTSETRSKQKWIIGLSVIYFLIIFLLPGFDKRFGWSAVPAWLVILADVVVIMAYMLYTFVLRTNSYASRIIEVEQGNRPSLQVPMHLCVIPCILQ